MSQNQGGTSFPSAVERAEQFWDSAGPTLKTWMQRAGQQAWQTTTSLPEKLSRTEEPSAERTEQSSGTSQTHTNNASSPPMERAEQIVHAMEQRLGEWTSATGLQVRRTAARLREDAEDMLAEAQSMRQHTNQP